MILNLMLGAVSQFTGVPGLFLPVKKFIQEIEHALGLVPTKQCPLREFLTMYIKNIFLNQVLAEINKEIEGVTKASDPLKILANADTMKMLGVQRPLLQDCLVNKQERDLKKSFVKLKSLSLQPPEVGPVKDITSPTFSLSALGARALNSRDADEPLQNQQIASQNIQLSVVKELESDSDTITHTETHLILQMVPQWDHLWSDMLFNSTVIVEKTVQDLMNLMHDLSAYSDQFLNMVCVKLQDYKETCTTAYRSIAQSDEKLVISASWAKDDDITRLLKSLPNWINMAQPKQLRPKREEEEDFIRAAFSKESEVLIGNLGDKLIPQQEILRDVSDLKALANMHESLEWLAGRTKAAFSNLPTAQTPSPGQDSHANMDLPPVSEQIMQTLSELAKSFQEMADRCLLVLHLEVRVHCFHYLIPLAKQGNYAIVANVESMDYDPLVVRLNKDISAVEEAMSASLQQHKFQYIFEGLGHLISCILINGAQYFKRISESGIKKMCRNIFILQQNLTNITMSREADLDFARGFNQWKPYSSAILLFSHSDAEGDGLGHLISCILINGAQYFKRISESGIKKMCRNIFILQQNLTNITMSREADLDFARFVLSVSSFDPSIVSDTDINISHLLFVLSVSSFDPSIVSDTDINISHLLQYYEMLYNTADELLNVVVDQGVKYTELEYIYALSLLHRSQTGVGDQTTQNMRLQRLKEIICEQAAIKQATKDKKITTV
ncbi:Exocyst complex component 4 [Chelonia mydas]|uniref:Exocyst complex component Sec8 n=1 Tax=Chelonia mydas TaxID=8469 RepID=M7C4P1_CHEMY|nr:Exocyst complex component 4 [Chelonia mydas]